MEEDPEAYHCETCPVRDWQARLGEDEREALRIYRLLRRPGVRTLGLERLVWEALDWHGTRDEALAMIDRLALLAEHDQRKAEAARPDEGHDGG